MHNGDELISEWAFLNSLVYVFKFSYCILAWIFHTDIFSWKRMWVQIYMFLEKNFTQLWNDEANCTYLCFLRLYDHFFAPVFVNRIPRFKICMLTYQTFKTCRNGGSYGNTGCGVFKRGGTKLERFLHKNQHSPRKLLYFENWINGGLRSFQKSEF